MGGSWDILNIGCELGKWLAKGNPETYPIKSNSNCHKSRTRPSLSESTCVCPHAIYCFSSKYTRSLLYYFPSSRKSSPAKQKGQGSCHWPLVLWSEFGALTAVAWPQSLAGNPSPAPSHCRLRPPEISLTHPKCVPGSHPFRIHLI